MTMPPLRPFVRALAATALAAGAAACRPKADAAPPPSDPPGEVHYGPTSPSLQYLTVDTVRPRTERVVATLPAQLVVNENHTARVASPVTGRISTVPVNLGDRVAAGAALAFIASSDVGLAESDLLKAEAALAQTQAALVRAKDLFANKVIAEKDLQQAVNDEAQARAERDRAKGRVTLLGAASTSIQQDFVLRSPIAGVVVERNASPGAQAQGDGSQSLFTISALDTLWLVANLYQRDLPGVKVGDRLRFHTDAQPGRDFDAKVSYVSSVLDPQTRTASLRATLANPGGLLRPQMFGEARLVAPDSGKTLVVPAEALVTDQDKRIVYVQVSPGRFRRREVTVGSEDRAFAEILSGVSAGELLVTRGSILVHADASQGR